MSLCIEQLRLEKRRADGTHEVLVESFSLTLEAGQTIALCGPSGCGKTSIAKSLLNLLPAAISRTGGSLTLHGQPYDDSWRGARIGMIFQEPRQAFHPLFSVGRLFEERLKLAGTPHTELRTATVSWLERIGIENPASRLGHVAADFSGGELQRMMIALALVRRPQFLIADEPTSNLDVLVQGRILGLLRRMQEELSLGILLITHDSRVARAMTDEIVELSPATSGGGR